MSIFDKNVWINCHLKAKSLFRVNDRKPLRSTRCLRQLLHASLGIFLIFSAESSLANKLGVWPIDPVLGADEKSTRIMAKNLNAIETTRVQASILAWEQDGTNEKLTEQHDIVISPPQIEIKPGSEQMFRVIKRNPLAPIDQHRAYRVLLEEVPSPSSADKKNSTIKITMKYSFPLTVEFEKKPKTPKQRVETVETGFTYQLISTPSPAIKLINQTPWIQRMSGVKIIDANEQPLAEIASGLWGYALANSGRQLQLTKKQYDLLKNPANKLIYTYNRQDYRIAQQH